MEEQRKKMVKVSAWIDLEEYKLFKIKLIQTSKVKSKSVAGWLREKIQRFIRE